MDCDQTRARILDDPEDPELRQHLVRCEGCGLLAAEGASLALALDASRATDSEASLDETLSRVLAEQAAERGLLAWLRSRPTPARRAVLLLAVLAVVVIGGLSLRGDLGDSSASRLLLALSPLCAAALVLGWNCIRPLHLPPLRGAPLGILLGLSVLLPFGVAFMPPRGLGSETVPASACFGFGTMLGLPLLILALLLDRAPSSARPTLLLAAGCAGLAANGSLELHCPVDDRMHLMLGHATVVVACCVVALGLLAALRSYRRAERDPPPPRPAR